MISRDGAKDWRKRQEKLRRQVRRQEDTRWGAQALKMHLIYVSRFFLFLLFVPTVMFLQMKKSVHRLLVSIVPIDLIDVRVHDSNDKMLYGSIEKALSGYQWSILIRRPPLMIHTSKNVFLANVPNQWSMARVAFSWCPVTHKRWWAGSVSSTWKTRFYDPPHTQSINATDQWPLGSHVTYLATRAPSGVAADVTVTVPTLLQIGRASCRERVFNWV